MMQHRKSSDSMSHPEFTMQAGYHNQISWGILCLSEPSYPKRLRMFHAAIHHQPVQDDRRLAAEMRARVTQFVRPHLTRLAQQLEIRLVQTARALVQVMLTHRHRAVGLPLSELGSYLLGPAHAP